jgi:hypothetical protein
MMVSLEQRILAALTPCPSPTGDSNNKPQPKPRTRGQLSPLAAGLKHIEDSLNHLTCRGLPTLDAGNNGFSHRQAPWLRLLGQRFFCFFES